MIKRLAPIFAALLIALSAPASVDARTPTARISISTALNRLKVQSEYQSGYSRSKFGSSWIDADGDGLDTRAEVLIDESKVSVSISGGIVRTGKWVSLYDNLTWTIGTDVDIDHVVALSEAWKSGAYRWSASRRLAFANDLGVSWSLRAVTDNVNASKGDRDPASWLPPYRASTCTYLVGWVAVKLRWGLSVDAAEKSAITDAWSSRGCAARSNPPRVEVRIAP
jgi:hypothetical protein